MFLRQRARYHRATARPTCICGWCNYVRARASGSMSALERFADSSRTSPEGPSCAKTGREQMQQRGCAEGRSYSITSSARASSICDTSRPSARAVGRLMTRSNLVGCWTGRSPGFAPRRILSTNSAVRRNRSGMLGP